MNWILLSQISSWTTVVITISLSLPQLFKLLKDKKTGNVNFLSFWVFHLGIMLWLVYGALSTIEVPHMLMNVIIADGFSILLNGVMTFLLYYFKRDFERKKLIYVAAGVLATWIISAVLVVIWVWYPTIRISSNAALVFSLIAPTFTTFAFVPQLIQSIKTKNWRGVSHWMILLFVVNNIVWNIFWISNIVINSQAQKGITDLIGALIWQTVSLIIYTYQYGATLYYNKKNLNNNENTKKVA